MTCTSLLRTLWPLLDRIRSSCVGGAFDVMREIRDLKVWLQDVQRSVAMLTNGGSICK